MHHATSLFTVDEHWAAYIDEGRIPDSPHENALARAFAPLVLRTVERLERRYANVDIDELTSNAFYGLLGAIRTFDPDKMGEGGFKSWAVNTMSNRIADGQRGTDWISRKRRTNIKAVADARSRLAADGTHFPTDAEVAAEADLDVDAVETADADAVISKVSSLDDLTSGEGPSADGGAASVAGGVGEHGSLDAVFKVLGLDTGLIDYFWDAVRMLADRPKQVIALYLYDGFQFKEIGTVLHVSESRVSQIFNEAGKRLRTNMEALAAA